MTFADDFVRGLYENGRNLIVMGVQDYLVAQSKKEERRYLSAISLSFGGVLLLLKSKLAEISAGDRHSLLYEKLLPSIDSNKRIVWLGPENSDAKTIGYEQIKERYKRFDLVDSCFWDDLNNVRKYRNNIEHGYVAPQENVVIGHMAAVRQILFTLATEVFNAKPEVEFNEVWDSLTHAESLNEKIRKEQTSQFKKLEWIDSRLSGWVKTYCCPSCGYPIVVVAEKDPESQAHQSKFECGLCKASIDYCSMVEELIRDHAAEQYGWRYKDQFYAPRTIGRCPECNRIAFDSECNKCLCCGYEHEYICDFCGEKLDIDEIETLDDSLHQYCAHCRYMLEKAARE